MNVSEQEYETITISFGLDEAETKRMVYNLFDELSIMMRNMFRGDAILLIESFQSITSRYVKALRWYEKEKQEKDTDTANKL